MEAEKNKHEEGIRRMLRDLFHPQTLRYRHINVLAANIKWE